MCASRATPTFDFSVPLLSLECDCAAVGLSGCTHLGTNDSVAGTWGAGFASAAQRAGAAHAHIQDACYRRSHTPLRATAAHFKRGAAEFTIRRREWVVCVSMYLVRHHRASLWLCSFSIACIKAASLQLRVSLPETSSWRERLRALEGPWISTGFLVRPLAWRGLATSAASPIARLRSKLHQLQLLWVASTADFSAAHIETTRVASCFCG